MHTFFRINCAINHSEILRHKTEVYYFEPPKDMCYMAVDQCATLKECE